MDAIAALLLVLVGFATFDFLAIRGGVDSRPSIGDDHRR
jgi:hypothetical protein